MNRLALLLLPLILLFPACGTFSNASEIISKSREVVKEVKDTYDQLKPVVDQAVETAKDLGGDAEELKDLYDQLKGDFDEMGDQLKDLDAEAFAKADKDGSGDLDWMERLVYLTILGGGALGIGKKKLDQLIHRKAEEKAAGQS